MSVYAEYNAGLISRDELVAAVRMEQWLDAYLEDADDDAEDDEQ